MKQKSFVLWFTGLSASGKSTIANLFYVLLLDGLYHGLNKDLGFDEKSRVEKNIRRVGETAKLFNDF